MERLANSCAILITGPMRAGKTTAAGYFREKYGMKKYALADKLKELHTAVTGIYEKDREWLQHNREAHRKVFGEDFWVNALLDSISAEKPHSLVVDDIRYRNEFLKLWEYTTSTYEIVIPIFIKVSLENIIARGGELELINHESEEMSRYLKNHIVQIGGHENVIIEGVNVPVINGNAPLRNFFFEIHDISKLPVKQRSETVDLYKVEDIC